MSLSLPGTLLVTNNLKKGVQGIVSFQGKLDIFIAGRPISVGNQGFWELVQLHQEFSSLFWSNPARSSDLAAKFGSNPAKGQCIEAYLRPIPATSSRGLKAYFWSISCGSRAPESYFGSNLTRSRALESFFGSNRGWSRGLKVYFEQNPGWLRGLDQFQVDWGVWKAYLGPIPARVKGMTACLGSNPTT